VTIFISTLPPIFYPSLLLPKPRDSVLNHGYIAGTQCN